MDEDSTAISLAEAELVVAALGRHQVPHLIIGSFCVELLAPGLLGRQPRDLDLLLPDERGPLESFVAAMHELGYAITSWQEAVSLPLKMEKLRGRFYLRATRNALIVDGTYECPWLPFAATRDRAQEVGPFIVACLADQKKLYRARDSEADRQMLRKLAPV